MEGGFVCVPLAGGDGGTSILSTLGRAAGGNALLALLDTRDATALRGVCREARDEVAAFPWDDTGKYDEATGRWVGGTRITGSLVLWRACFPHALGANVNERRDLVDADFAHLCGVLRLFMRGCVGITDGAFAHLRGVHTLDMRGCASVTDGAFVHLRDVQRLNIRDCAGVTDAAFAHLGALEVLNLGAHSSVTGAALAHAPQLEVLDVSFEEAPIVFRVGAGRWNRVTFQPYTSVHIRDADLSAACLPRLRSLNMSWITQPEITAAGIEGLAHTLRFLDVTGCDDAVIAAGVARQAAVGGGFVLVGA